MVRKPLNFIFALLLLMLAASGTLTAQTNDAAPTGKVKWQGLSGKNDEFYFLMPEGFQAVADGDYYRMTKNGGKAQISEHRTLARYINGVVLLMEFYEGDVRDILSGLIERQKGQSVKDETVNNFQFKSYVEKTPEFVRETQYFTNNKRLYVLQSVSREANNRLARDFFESVRLVNQKQYAAPNAGAGANAGSVAILPEIIEKTPERVDDSQAGAEKPDRDVIILYKPRPRYASEARRMRISGTVKLRALFSSSGKITKLEVVSSPGRELNESAIKAAQKTQFLPAEKDGKLVSTYKTIEYSFSTY
ncbi:MAG TPA: energy transducer TonB [Pyrinomonadaceae bacterium]